MVRVLYLIKMMKSHKTLSLDHNCTFVQQPARKPVHVLRVFDQDDEIGDPQGLTVVTTLVKWNLKADAKKDVCSSLAPLGACTQWGQTNSEENF